jgi:predicted DNA binding protein
MSVNAEVSLSSPRLNLYEATTAVPDVTVDVESVDVGGDGEVKTMAWAVGGDLDAFDEALRDDPTTTDVTLLDDLPDRRLYSYRNSEGSELQLYTDWLELGAAQLHVECVDGSWFQRVRFPDRDALADFEARCQREDVEFSLQRIYGESGSGESGPLTDAQREALKLALDAGYLDVPRSATLTDVADELGVSEQSASERLRRAARNLAVDALSPAAEN